MNDANAGREWLSEANQLIERARINVPTEVKPSRRQRRKQQALAVVHTTPADERKNGVDLNADLVE